MTTACTIRACTTDPPACTATSTGTAQQANRVTRSIHLAEGMMNKRTSSSSTSDIAPSLHSQCLRQHYKIPASTSSNHRNSNVPPTRTHDLNECETRFRGTGQVAERVVMAGDKSECESAEWLAYGVLCSLLMCPPCCCTPLPKFHRDAPDWEYWMPFRQHRTNANASAEGNVYGLITCNTVLCRM